MNRFWCRIRHNWKPGHGRSHFSTISRECRRCGKIEFYFAAGIWYEA